MKQNIEKVVLKGCFFWYFLALHYLCGYAAKVLPLEKAKIHFAFSSLNRTFGLRPKVGCASTMKTKYFVFCFALSSAFTTFATPWRRYSRSKKQKRFCFFLA